MHYQMVLIKELNWDVTGLNHVIANVQLRNIKWSLDPCDSRGLITIIILTVRTTNGYAVCVCADVHVCIQSVFHVLLFHS